MQKIVKDVWVDNYDHDFDITVFSDKEVSDNFESFKDDIKSGVTLKAKLIIEIPEKKVTITESEFNEAIKKAVDEFKFNQQISVTSIGKVIKKELGF